MVAFERAQPAKQSSNSSTQRKQEEEEKTKVCTYLRMYDTYLQHTLALVVRAHMQTDTESRSQEKRDREGKNSILLESSRVESSSWKFF